MHSTTNNPNLRKNFVGNLLKNYIHDTILEADSTNVWDELHLYPFPPKQLLQHHSICIQWQCGALLSKMCSVFSESKPRPLANISRSTHV